MPSEWLTYGIELNTKESMGGDDGNMLALQLILWIVKHQPPCPKHEPEYSSLGLVAQKAHTAAKPVEYIHKKKKLLPIFTIQILNSYPKHDFQLKHQRE